jgi:ubiquinone/menaquinone biosynthesis C-methylase UbiE
MRLVLPLFLLLSNFVLAQVPEKDKRPENLPKDINSSFLNPDLNVDEFIGRFEVESREVFSCREQIYRALKMQPGLAVADIGSGTGLFLEPLSKGAGGTGKVFAVEISPKFVKHLRQRADKESLKNVEVVFCSDRDANLKPNTIDRALICDVYHHFEYPASTMKSVYDAMKSGGRLVVVDFNRIEGKSRQWTMDHVRAGKEVFQREILDAGFKFEGEVEVEGFKENYLLVFTKS